MAGRGTEHGPGPLRGAAGESPTALVGREEELALLGVAGRAAVGGRGKCRAGFGRGWHRQVPAHRRARGSAALGDPHGTPVLLLAPAHGQRPFPVISQIRGAAELAPDDTPEQKVAKFAHLLAPAAFPSGPPGTDPLDKTLCRLEAALTSSVHTEESIGLSATLLSGPTGERYRLLEQSPQGRKESRLRRWWRSSASWRRRSRSCSCSKTSTGSIRHHWKPHPALLYVRARSTP